MNYDAFVMLLDLAYLVGDSVVVVVVPGRASKYPKLAIEKCHGGPMDRIHLRNIESVQ